ncbi:MAG TPA: ATP-dependent RecD-like DNA helicase [Clostridiaceae bacterium]|nr:ATP-dependent RecD-like DNA helicase [Clostridiaceae bacterium]
MEEISGIVSSIRYSNEKTGYTVCDLKSDDNKNITLVGIMPLLAEGESIIAAGEFVVHPDYGRQFAVRRCERKEPTREDSIMKYLSSGFIKGMGASTAKKIVDHFREETFEVLKYEPYRLTEIKGISPERALYFGQAFLEHDRMRNLVMLVQSYGISSGIAARLWNKYGTEAEEEIRKNPYLLSESDIGLSFQACDRIALSSGFEPYSKERLKGAVKYVLWESISDGHTYIPMEELLKAGVKLTGAAEEYLQDAIDALRLEGLIAAERQHPDRIYAEELMEAERYCARKLSLMNKRRDESWIEQGEELVEKYEKELDIYLDDIQKEAVICALSNNVSVITGGPGTGKTTIIRTLIKIFEEKGLKTMLTAPTGRAAKRISETSGYEARTIHRLLEVGYSIENNERPYFMRDEDNPVEADVLIIDEASMIDITIMNALLRALPHDTRLVLVGDSDQLPSVGPGKVLSDIITSNAFPVVRLKTIFRQTEQSSIISNAHLINMGQMPELNHDEGDFYFITKLGGRSVNECIIELCSNKIPEQFGFDPIRDIQVLSPMKKGETGVRQLNVILQQVLNPEKEGKPQKAFGNTIFRLGDRVMQIRNDYAMPWTQYDEKGLFSEGLGVYNGDLGIIEDIDMKAELITVRFDDNRVAEYSFDKADSLEHAFAITVHKSQGTEFPVVVIPLSGVPKSLVCRKILYTAVTRARKLVVLVGSPEIMEEMIGNENEKDRYSGLRERLSENRILYETHFLD